jgi:hypothetical protein
MTCGTFYNIVASLSNNSREHYLQTQVLSMSRKALARLLVEKGALTHYELADMLNTMQVEYQPRIFKED